jgi:hypothetical protein
MPLAALAACASPQKLTETLIDSSFTYQEGLRWSRYEDSASLVPPQRRETFLDERDDIAVDLRIDDYEVIRIKLRNNKSEAHVRVKYMWHLDSEGVVHETITDQTWMRKGKLWFVMTEVRRSGEPMPGVEEKPRDAAPEEDGEEEVPPADGDAKAASPRKV